MFQNIPRTMENIEEYTKNIQHPLEVFFHNFELDI